MASMACLWSLPVTGQDIVAGFDRFDDPFTGDQTTDAAIVYPGVTATLTVSGVNNSEWYRVDNGCNDGTFGPTKVGADNTQTGPFYGALTTAGVVNQDDFYLEIEIVNNSVRPLELVSVAFDVWRDFNGSPPRVDLVVISGDLTNGYAGQTAFIDQQGASPSSLNANDYADLNMVNPVTSLADHTLDVGESAVLQLQVWESTFTLTTAGRYSFDNIAVLAVPIPAPEIEIAVAAGTDPEITFLSELGGTYQLQKSPDLSAESWSDVAGQSVVGDGTEKTLSDAGALSGPSKAFYRVTVN